MHAHFAETVTVKLARNSVALSRLIVEVRDNKVELVRGAYNRTYNRHNR